MSAPVEVGYGLVLADNIPVPATSASVPVKGRACAVGGWSFREVTGTATADCQLFDGTSNNGDIIAEITLSPGQSIRDTTGAYCVRAQRGVFLQVNSGTVRGSVWAVDLPGA
jgi:hypothetical protein